MPTCINDIGSNDFMDPFKVAQLADDTIIIAEHRESMCNKFNAAIKYSAD